MNNHVTRRRDNLLTTDGGGFLDDQLFKDSLHSHLQVVGNKMRTTFGIGSPRTSVLIIEVTDKQSTKELLHLLPSDCALGGVIVYL